MSYLIDGHNLIPKIPGLTLKDPDDEQKLIELLQEFTRQHRKKIDVYFDQAPPGFAGTRRYGMVIAHFVAQDITADQAIENRLVQLKHKAANYIVVSSDRRVTVAARSYRAQVITSENFAQLILQSREQSQNDELEKPVPELSQSEINEWLKLFQNGDEHE